MGRIQDTIEGFLEAVQAADEGPDNPRGQQPGEQGAEAPVVPGMGYQPGMNSNTAEE